MTEIEQIIGRSAILCRSGSKFYERATRYAGVHIILRCGILRICWIGDIIDRMGIHIQRAANAKTARCIHIRYAAIAKLDGVAGADDGAITNSRCIRKVIRSDIGIITDCGIGTSCRIDVASAL